MNEKYSTGKQLSAWERMMHVLHHYFKNNDDLRSIRSTSSEGRGHVIQTLPHATNLPYVIWLIWSCYSKSGELQVRKMRRQTAWFRTLPSSLSNMMAQAMPDPIFTHQ